MFWTLLLHSQPAMPCAAMTVRDGEFASSDAQEVILRRTDGGSEISYQVTYDGDATEFGWLIVVPGEASSVSEGDASRFDTLRDATDPLVNLRSLGGGSGSSGCFCGSSKMDAGGERGGANFADTGGVDILAEGFSGPYEYTVLSADDDTALIDWLEDHEFELGGTETTLAEYVDEGGYSFVAVTLTPDEASTPDGGRKLPPLDITTNSTELRFPARMAQTGAPEWVRTIVWVEGDQRAIVQSGWTEEMVAYLDSNDQQPSEFYEAHLQSMASVDPVYAQVFSGEVDGSWVTRFDTYASREVHSEDVVFDMVEDQEPNHLTIEGEATDFSWIFLPLFGLGWGLRRRPRS